MDNQTESYIVLKPLADRFNRIAKEITDDEIKSLIKGEIREQIKTINFKHDVQAIISDYIETHESDIIELYKRELNNKFQ